jgi:hypothetical protein
MNNAKIGILIASVAVIAFSFIAISSPILNADNSGSKTLVHYDGWVDIWKTNALTGQVTHILNHKHNQITSIGQTFIVNKLNSVDTNNSNRTLAMVLASNGTAPSIAWTKITDELNSSGLARNTTGQFSMNGTNGFNVSSTWTATSPQSNVELTGLQWENASMSDGNLFAAVQFSNTSLLTNDQIAVTWQVTIS